MKLCLLALVLTTTAAFCGEIADQFPKHPKGVTSQESNYSSGYGIKQIGVEHTPCYGNCPIFTLIVNSDGTFRYHGELFVKRRGDWHGTVNLTELQSILRYIHEIGYFELDDKYAIDLTDLSGTYTMVVTAKRKKIVYNYGDAGPAKLGALEDMIDRLMEQAKWKRRQAMTRRFFLGGDRRFSLPKCSLMSI